jgi:hypothetical protein
LGAEHQLRTLAALAGVDALHGRREVGDVERTLQRGRQRGVADVDDNAGALGPEVGACALAVEAQDQLAGAAVAALEVHGRNRDHAGDLLGRIDGGSLGHRQPAGCVCTHVRGACCGRSRKQAGEEAESQGLDRDGLPDRLPITHCGDGHL